MGKVQKLCSHCRMSADAQDARLQYGRAHAYMCCLRHVFDCDCERRGFWREMPHVHRNAMNDFAWISQLWWPSFNSARYGGKKRGWWSYGNDDFVEGRR